MINNSDFMTSVADTAKLPLDGVPEIAIAGKSNVGKSSFINTLTNRIRLAKTSSEPGRTRLINYFTINNDAFRLVDLPGYGFARVPDEEKAKWARMMERYFVEASALKHVFVLVDIRHEPGANDKQMIAYLHHYGIPFSIVATKSDKLSPTRAREAAVKIAAALAQGADDIILFSSLKKTGKEAVFERIGKALSR